MSNVLTAQQLNIIQDLFRTTGERMSLQTCHVIAFNRDEMNLIADTLAQRSAPALMYRFVQSGSYTIRVNGKTFLNYSGVELLFLYLIDEPEDSEPSDVLNVVRQSHSVAIEFFQRLIREQAFDEFIDNTGLNVTFDEVAYLFDANMAGVACTFDFTINPNAPTPSC